MQENRVPPVDAALVEWLEREFPDCLPQYAQETPTDVNVLIGQQRVIRFLRHTYEEQTDNTTPIR